MRHVLFLCTGNSCRSQMAEGFARHVAPPGVTVHSAGTAPVGIHPKAVEAMAELGIDLADQRSKDLSALPLDEIDTVVTLCGDAAETCPAFPGPVKRIHWPLPDPAAARGSQAEVRAVFRSVRDDIRARVEALFAADSAADSGAESTG